MPSGDADLLDEIARLRSELAARDAFLSVVGHELRNPITPILMHVQKLRRQDQRRQLTPEQLGPALESLEAHILHFVRRATTLLDVSRARAGAFAVDPRWIDVGQTVRASVDHCLPAAEFARCAITCLAPAGTIGWADPLVVEQIAENLVTNAIKYGRGAPIRVTVAEDGDGWDLRVEDGGPGIAEADRERVFARFERLLDGGVPVEGFGIGLWLVRELVHAMGGSIDVGTSDLGGAEVRVHAPWHLAGHANTTTED
ncbi:sensor histidine kinase KdpD [uncultured Alsobacter sp.]|uniref:sensor histidine kinase n=1 Tax=uncultured Alsobacter sp. TaxID=1748258 RepID=UPI0025DDB86D|nr:HAMP domain-containing sensor histidine kinase [uncultured Alsobacter sp.]